MPVWTQWMYQYGVGGLLVFGTVFLALRTGAIRWRHPVERRLLTALVAAFLIFMFAHAAWIALASR